MRFGSMLKHATAAALLLGAATAHASNAPAVEPRVKEVIQKMVDFFAGADTLTFKALVTTEDVSSTLQKLQYDNLVEGAMQRPNKVYFKKSGNEQVSLWFDGTTITILDRKANKYSKVPLSGNFSAMVAKLDDLGIETPFAGLFDQGIMKQVDDHVFKGDSYGDVEIDGRTFTHLALRQDSVDWQLWTDAATGAPKKVVITSKMLAAAPEHQIFLKETVKNPTLASDIFQPKIPSDATEVPIQSEDSESLRNSSW